METNEVSEKDALLAEIKRLRQENERLKQEIAKLRGVKRPSGDAMDTMSTKLKEALRE
ncbi:hypothetical protein GCM10008018_67830 [Paenibacillus marchantiophytorum]|uniref:Transposase n=1 Tax=Paenibacillus marchantiophytorum TaxID=1619310 RepID=A0ABQ1FHF7_9BACL|nr:hypothetical protein [Paenibacillus marchantiophytorum]GGA13373.1 hypothetical protein GCM10008018_67830 [Paenibacillus marchantiophytorum]